MSKVPEPAAGTLWRHRKTNTLYIALGVALCSTNGDRENVERSVVYWSLSKGQMRYRDIAEFMDGRFEPWGPDRK